MKLLAGSLMAIGLVATITYALAGGTVGQQNAAAGKAAAHAGGRQKKVVTTAFPQLNQFNDLKSLTDGSGTVVVGVPVSQSSRVSSSSQNFVWTEYQVKVLSVLKGEIQPGGLISVRAMGGKAAQKDGTEVETQMPDFWKSPVVGDGYVFFLSARGNAARRFELTGGPQGLFLISPWKGEGAGELSLTPDQLVVPQVRASDKLMKSYAGMPAEGFVGRVRGVVAGGVEGK